jgi:hypothetical protein
MTSPGSFAASDGTIAGVQLTWNQMLGAEGYRLYRNGALIATLGQNATSHLDTGAPLSVANFCIAAYSGAISSVQVCNTGYPTPPALTVTISGPTSRAANQSGTWTAVVSGGIGPYTYQWSRLIDCPPGGPSPSKTLIPTCWEWYPIGSGTNSLTSSSAYDFQLRCQVSDVLGTIRIDEHCIDIPGVFGDLGCGGGTPAPTLTKAEDVPDQPPGFVDLEDIARGETMQLSFRMASESVVVLRLFDVAGREVARLPERRFAAGLHQVSWPFGRLVHGVYFARLETSGATYTRKVLVLR